MVNLKVKRNPKKTRSDLLQAGVELFSERGYDGVSVDQIVAAAGINKRMLYHYYGSKDGLYVEVLRTVFARLEVLESETLDHPATTEEALRNVLASYFRFLQDQPQFVSLLMWENLNRGKFLDAHPDLLTKSPVLRRLRKIVERAKQAGEIEETVDARHLLVVLYGMCFFYHSNRFTLKHTVGLNFGKQSVFDEGMRFTQEILLRGLLR